MFQLLLTFSTLCVYTLFAFWNLCTFALFVSLNACRSIAHVATWQWFSGRLSLLVKQKRYIYWFRVNERSLLATQPDKNCLYVLLFRVVLFQGEHLEVNNGGRGRFVQLVSGFARTKNLSDRTEYDRVTSSESMLGCSLRTVSAARSV